MNLEEQRIFSNQDSQERWEPYKAQVPLLTINVNFQNNKVEVEYCCDLKKRKEKSIYSRPV